MVAPDLATELAHALAITTAIFAVVRFRPGGSAVILLVLAIAATVYVANPAHRVYSFGGFWHHSIVYEILNGRIPPSNPLAAGEPLRWPWGAHLAAATTSRALDVTPPMSFALLNLACLALTAVALRRIAALLELGPATSALTVAVALFGITPLNLGGLALLLQPVLPVTMDFRGTPVLSAFLNPGAESFAVAGYAWAICALLRLFASEDPRMIRSCASLLAAVAGALFFSPILGLGVFCASAASIAILSLRGADRRHFAAAVGIGGALLLTLPYLRQFDGDFAIDDDGWRIVEDALRAALTCGVAIAIIAWQKAAFSAVLRRRGPGVIVLSTASATTALLYVFGKAPQGAEHVMLMSSTLSLGILAGPALGALYERYAVAAFLLVAMLLVPLATNISLRTDRSFWRTTDRYVETGAALEARDPYERELQSWIRAHTTTDDAFVDTWLTVPVFAERPLFLGVDWRPRRGAFDGWAPGAGVVLRELTDVPASVVDARGKLVRALLRDVARPTDAELAIVRESGIRGNFYVIARSFHQAVRLEADPRLERLFVSSRAAVYRLRDRVNSGAGE